MPNHAFEAMAKEGAARPVAPNHERNALKKKKLRFIDAIPTETAREKCAGNARGRDAGKSFAHPDAAPEKADGRMN